MPAAQLMVATPASCADTASLRRFMSFAGEIGKGEIDHSEISRPMITMMYERHGLIRDRVPIDFDPRDFRLRRRRGFLVYHVNRANLKI